MRISDWSSDVCSSDLLADLALRIADEEVGRCARTVARIEKRAARKRGDVADIALGRFGRRLQPFDLARPGVAAENGMFERVLLVDVDGLAVGRPGDRADSAVPRGGGTQLGQAGW